MESQFFYIIIIDNLNLILLYQIMLVDFFKRFKRNAYVVFNPKLQIEIDFKRLERMRKIALCSSLDRVEGSIVT